MTLELSGLWIQIKSVEYWGPNSTSLNLLTYLTMNLLWGSHWQTYPWGFGGHHIWSQTTWGPSLGTAAFTVLWATSPDPPQAAAKWHRSSAHAAAQCSIYAVPHTGPLLHALCLLCPPWLFPQDLHSLSLRLLPVLPWLPKAPLLPSTWAAAGPGVVTLPDTASWCPAALPYFAAGPSALAHGSIAVTLPSVTSWHASLSPPLSPRWSALTFCF